MARKLTSAKVRKETVAHMKALGTYRPEYDPLIEIYADQRIQYDTLLTRWKEDGMPFEVMSAAGTPKKAPIVATLENLRKDILLYSNQLGLNPRAHNAMRTEGNKQRHTSKLEAALRALDSS